MARHGVLLVRANHTCNPLAARLWCIMQSRYPGRVHHEKAPYRFTDSGYTWMLVDTEEKQRLARAQGATAVNISSAILSALPTEVCISGTESMWAFVNSLAAEGGSAVWNSIGRV